MYLLIAVKKEKRADIVMQTKKKHTYTQLDWDTSHFGVKSAKLSLHQSILTDELLALIKINSNVEFLTIVNENSNPQNSKIIGEESKAFLTDINIQFQKQILKQSISDSVIIQNNVESNQTILDIATFQTSRFIEDPNLASRGGKQVYKEWLINSFNKKEKYFAKSYDSHREINGFVLFSFTNNKCVIELIAANVSSGEKGIGTKLFKAVEGYAYEENIELLQVGTQIRNLSAINFYHKMGCKQVGCHQVYHLWN